MRIAIIGGGASGLACCVALYRNARKKSKTIDVSIFEAKERVGKKILATGNGRCNLMNTDCSADFFSDPDFVKPSLKRYDTLSNLDFFSKAGLYTRCDEEGRVYPLSNQASSVLDVLRMECESYGAKIYCDVNVSEVTKNGNGFLVNGDYFDRIVLCCGSKAGVKGFTSYELIKKLGHRVIEPRPSLTKICVKENKFTKSLKGIRSKADVTLYLNGSFVAKEQGEILFNEYGLSGIAVMQLSAFIARNRKANYADYTITADFVPDMDIKTLIENITALTQNRNNLKNEYLLCGFVPKKLGEMILKTLGTDLARQVCTLSKKQISDIASRLKSFTFSVQDLRGFDDAQVVSGGADNIEFNPHTLESKKVKGLYCCGELLNVDGLCGGYNLLWAWSSARVCAESITESI